MQLATKTFLHHITNMSPFIKNVRHVNLICNKETDERSRFPPISTRKGFLKKKKKKKQDVRKEVMFNGTEEGYKCHLSDQSQPQGNSFLILNLITILSLSF